MGDPETSQHHHDADPVDTAYTALDAAPLARGVSERSVAFTRWNGHVVVRRVLTGARVPPVIMENVTLFSGMTLHQAMWGRRDRIATTIRSANLDQLTDEFAAHLISQNTVVPISLQLEQAWIEGPVEHRNRVPDPMYRQTGRLVVTMTYTLVVPFSGSAELLSLQPNPWEDPGPEGSVTDHELRIPVTVISSATADEIKRKLDTNVARVEKHLAWGRPEVSAYHDWLQQVSALVHARRMELEGVKAKTESLGFPVRTPAQRPPSPARKTSPATITPDTDALRERVIKFIIAFGDAMSSAPGTWESLTEEGIRDLIVAAVNGLVPGQVVAEAFNGRGKVDLLVRVDGINILIVECKHWTGKNDFTEALEQLLSYTPWRDTSIAIMPFLKLQAVTRAIREAIAAIEGLTNWQGPSPAFDSTRMDFPLHATGDPEQLITLTLLPVPLATSAKPRPGRTVKKPKKAAQTRTGTT